MVRERYCFKFCPFWLFCKLASLEPFCFGQDRSYEWKLKGRGGGEGERGRGGEGERGRRGGERGREERGRRGGGEGEERGRRGGGEGEERGRRGGGEGEERGRRGGGEGGRGEMERMRRREEMGEEGERRWVDDVRDKR